MGAGRNSRPSFFGPDMPRMDKAARSATQYAPFAETVEKYLTTSPVAVSKTELGPGARVMVCIADEPANRNNESFYLYAECRLPGSPPNMDIGYTMDDFVRHSGVMIFKALGGKRFFGECITLERFLKARPVGERTTRLLRETLQRLEENVECDQNFVDEANDIWKNRDSKTTTLVGPKYLN
jgi:hypothetical protein